MMQEPFVHKRAFAAICIILSLPLCIVAWMSVVGNDTKGLTFDGYVELMTALRLGELLHIALRAFGVSLVSTMLAFIFSWLLVQYTSDHVQNFLLILMSLPLLINESVRVFSWQFVLAENGIFNHFLTWISGTSVTVFNASNNNNIYFMMVVACVPFGVFICAMTLKIIPQIYWMASRDLKMNGFSRFWRIGLPMSRFSLLISLTVIFFIAFSLSSEVNFLGGDTKLSTRNFVLSLMSAGKFQTIFAFGFVINLILLSLFAITTLFIKRRTVR